jgi:hypothetical protein
MGEMVQSARSSYAVNFLLVTMQPICALNMCTTRLDGQQASHWRTVLLTPQIHPARQLSRLGGRLAKRLIRSSTIGLASRPSQAADSQTAIISPSIRLAGQLSFLGSCTLATDFSPSHLALSANLLIRWCRTCKFHIGLQQNACRLQEFEF